MSETLRPRSLGELFSQTLHLIFTNLPSLIAIQAVFWLPLSLLNHFFIMEALEGTLVRTDDTGPAAIDPEDVQVREDDLLRGADRGRPPPFREWPSVSLLALLSGLIILLSGLIIKPVAEAATMLVISDHFVGRRTAIGAAIGLALRKLFPLLMVAFVVSFFAWLALSIGFFVFFILMALGPLGVLAGVVVLLGSFLLFAWVYITYGVAAPAVVLESLTAREALQRSRTLTEGSRVKIYYLVSAISLVMLGIGAAIGLAVSVTPGLDPSAVMVEWGIKTVLNMVQLMLVSVGIVVVYFDLRVRKDGFDLDNLAELVDVIAQRAATTEGGESMAHDA